jgi:alanine racemase
MTGLNLHVDAERWRHHISHYLARYNQDLIPVIKGNGYGFGIPTLAREASSFQAECVACYSAEEAAIIRSQFSGDVLLLAPNETLDEEWVIHTIAPTSENFHNVRPRRFVIELLSPVKRHGFQPSAINAAISKHSEHGTCVGLAIHLPINPRGSMVRWINEQLASIDISSERFANSIWLSHISAEDLIELKRRWPTIRWRVRVGTDLWLGARTCLTATATVVDRHRISSPERVGYRQDKIRSGWLIVAAGGTAHGIGLEVPTSGLRALVKAVFRLFGWNPSPFSWNGRALSFAEPPHMHNSLLTLRTEQAPEIGEEIGLNVRFTTTTFHEVIFE